MKRDEWKALLERHPHWEVVGKRDDRLVIHNTHTGRWYEVDPATDATPEEVTEVLEGIREPVMLYTITRIVGYYSTTANWNRSKLGELADRRKGDYSLSPSQDSKRKDRTEVSA